MFHACVRRFDVMDTMDTVGKFFGTKHDIIILVFVPPPMALGKLQRCAHLARSKASERENRSRHTCGGRSSSRRQIPDTLRHPRGRDHGAPRAGGECRAPGGATRERPARARTCRRVAPRRWPAASWCARAPAAAPCEES